MAWKASTPERAAVSMTDSKAAYPLSAPIRAKAADNFTMDHRGSQSSLAEVVGWRDICTVQENEQMLAKLAITALEFAGFRLE